MNNSVVINTAATWTIVPTKNPTGVCTLTWSLEKMRREWQKPSVQINRFFSLISKFKLISNYSHLYEKKGFIMVRVMEHGWMEKKMKWKEEKKWDEKMWKEWEMSVREIKAWSSSWNIQKFNWISSRCGENVPERIASVTPKELLVNQYRNIGNYNEWH